MTYSTKYNRGKKIIKIKEHEGRNYLMVDGYILGKVYEGVKKLIDIEEFDDTKILKKYCCINDTAIKDDGKFYSELFLEEAFYDE